MDAVVRDETQADTPQARRWVALVVVALAQLTIALDATIVAVALPSAQAALGFPDAQRHWVITAYTAAFGGLLLLGGRISDRVGRHRTFVAGLGGFGVASGLGALAPDLAVLAVARGLQGAFAALLAPTVLALLSVGFPDPRDRGRAFAVFGAVAGGGGAVGLVLGGLLAESVGWRGCLFVNVPIVAATALGVRYLPRTGGDRAGRPWDVPGALLVTVALVAVVAACSHTVPTAWAVGLLAVGGVLLAAFVRRESHAPAPLLPLHVLVDRVLVGACLTVALAVAGMLGAFLVLTYVLQVVLGFSPLGTGLAFLPLSAALFASAQVVGRVMARVDVRVLVVPGLLVAATGMLLLTRLSARSTYPTGVLPAELLIGLGIGAVFTPVISLATGRAVRQDAGVTAAVVSTAQQLGASVGVAVLNAVAAVATAAARTTTAGPGRPTVDALVAGYTTAVGVAAAVLAAAVLAALLITRDAPPRPGPPARPRADVDRRRRDTAMTDDETVLVTGASGHVGGELIAQLAATGHRVRAMTRRPHDLTVPSGVEVVAGDAADPGSLDVAFAGVDRAFLMSAENVGATPRPTHVPAYVDAAVRAGVGHLVLLSVHSGGEGDDVFADWWRQIEGSVVESGPRATVLRPGRFMSNALAWAPQIARGDDIAVPFAHRPTTSIDPADIAAVAAAALTDTSGRHDGAVHQLSGPQVMTPAEELAEVAVLVGRPLRVVEPPLEQVRAGMARAGMPEAVIDAAVARTLASDDGTEVLPTVERVLGRPARPFAVWLDAHHAAFAP